MADYRNIPNGSSIFEFTKDEPCVLVVDYSDMNTLYDLAIEEGDVKLVDAIHNSLKAATDRKLDRLEQSNVR